MNGGPRTRRGGSPAQVKIPAFMKNARNQNVRSGDQRPHPQILTARRRCFAISATDARGISMTGMYDAQGNLWRARSRFQWRVMEFELRPFTRRFQPKGQLTAITNALDANG